LLTGHVGDKAELALRKSGIKIIDGFKNTKKVIDALNNIF